MKQHILSLIFLTSILTYSNAQNTEKNNTDFFDESETASKDTLLSPILVVSKGVQETDHIEPLQPSQRDK